MYRFLKKNISYNLQNAFGWRTDRKILVIESDDWGSIRMPSKDAYFNLLQKGIPVNKSPYNRLDSLESEDDILALYNLLKKIKDNRSNNLKITANTIMANPDFNKIKDNNFNQYHYINLEETYECYNGNTNVLKLFKEGFKCNFLIPQLHGREHLHPLEWMKALKSSDRETLLAFNNRVWGHPSNYYNGSKMNFSSALHVLNQNHFNFAKESIIDGSNLFEKMFDFRSESFIAPRYIWGGDIEEILKNVGVKYIQGKIVQLVPQPNHPNKFKNKINYLGKKNKNGQNYLIRNVFFEPAQNPKHNWVHDALNRTRIAFRWSKPAIISMHRINFMGGLNIDNRTRNLYLLEKLINKIISEFPDVEFLSSNELGKIIENEK